MKRTITMLTALLALFIGSLPAYAQPTHPAAPAARNPIPHMPVVLDGVPVSPATLHRYDAQDLHYVVDDTSLRQGFVYVFTVKAKRDAFVQASAAREAKTVRPLGLNGAWFYEHIDLGGQSVDYWGNVASFGWWNDRISSLHTDYGITVLYEDSSYSGSTFTIQGQHYIYSLKPWGWNDEVSSISFH